MGTVLFISELKDYNSSHVERKMEIHPLNMEQIRINIDITVYGSPCACILLFKQNDCDLILLLFLVLSLDLEDELGNHVSDYKQTINMIRLNSSGYLI